MKSKDRNSQKLIFCKPNGVFDAGLINRKRLPPGSFCEAIVMLDNNPEEIKKIKQDLFLLYQHIARKVKIAPDTLTVENLQNQQIQAAFSLIPLLIYGQQHLSSVGVEFSEKDFLALQKAHYNEEIENSNLRKEENNELREEEDWVVEHSVFSHIQQQLVPFTENFMSGTGRLSNLLNNQSIEDNLPEKLDSFLFQNMSQKVRQIKNSMNQFLSTEFKCNALNLLSSKKKLNFQPNNNKKMLEDAIKLVEKANNKAEIIGILENVKKNYISRFPGFSGFFQPKTSTQPGQSPEQNTADIKDKIDALITIYNPNKR